MHKNKNLLLLIICFCIPFFSSEASPTIHVIGDSHSIEFSQIPGCTVHWLGPITMHRVGRDGFSAIHLPTLGVQDHQIAIFSFGEIDVRCHIGKIRDQYNQDINEVIEILATQYIHTILRNRALYENLTCIVYSVTPPTVSSNPDYPIYGPLEDRVAISKKLNNRLACLCKQTNIEFLDVYDDYANPDGTLNNALSDGSVHIHTNSSIAITKKLNQILAKLASAKPDTRYDSYRVPTTVYDTAVSSFLDNSMMDSISWWADYQ